MKRVADAEIKTASRGSTNRARGSRGSGSQPRRRDGHDGWLEETGRDETRGWRPALQTRVNRTYSTLAALAADARRHPPAIGGEHSTRLLLDATFLVAIAGTARFRDAARRAARSLNRDGYGVEVTGPWPPYNFIEA
jgi:hypothetical protein